MMKISGNMVKTAVAVLLFGFIAFYVCGSLLQQNPCIKAAFIGKVTRDNVDTLVYCWASKHRPRQFQHIDCKLGVEVGESMGSTRSENYMLDGETLNVASMVCGEPVIYRVNTRTKDIQEVPSMVSRPIKKQE